MCNNTAMSTETKPYNHEFLQELEDDSFSDEERRAYEAEVLNEIAKSLEEDDFLANAGVQVTCFTSYSAGNGRSRRRPREVILVKFAGYTHQFNQERYPAYRNADSHAQQVFSDHADNGHDPYSLYFDAVLQAISKR